MQWNTVQAPDGNHTLIATATSVTGKPSQASRTVQVQQFPSPPPTPVMISAINFIATNEWGVAGKPLFIGDSPSGNTFGVLPHL